MPTGGSTASTVMTSVAYAYIPDINDPGKLKVVLDGVPVEGDCKYIGRDIDITANSSLFFL